MYVGNLRYNSMPYVTKRNEVIATDTKTVSRITVTVTRLRWNIDGSRTTAALRERIQTLVKQCERVRESERESAGEL